MESIEERLNKARQERIAREKARIDKLRELNLKKYSKNEAQSISKASSIASLANKTLNSEIKPRRDQKNNMTTNNVKNILSVNGASKRPLAVPIPSKPCIDKTKPAMKNANAEKSELKHDRKMPVKNRLPITNIEKKNFVNSNKVIAKSINKLPVNTKNVTNVPNVRKSLAPIKITSHVKLPEQPKLLDKPKESRKSLLPVRPGSVSKNRESVFDRLYKPKMVQRTDLSDVDRLQRDPIFLQKVLQQGSFIANKRHTIAPNFAKPVAKAPVRRSISAVHLKRISKKELGNCFHKWSSIGEKLNEIDITNTNEDDKVKQDTITSAIKSERKRVRLHTPAQTPRPEELQLRLQKWLQSRGKSIDSYQHLQCFGLHMREPLKPLFIKETEYDEENKENIALDHDSDNESYTDNVNDRDSDFDKNKWRGRVSYVSDSVCMNDSGDTTLNSEETPLDDVLLGALNDLTELLREGFDWEQCARWLRAIRGRYSLAPSLAAYWECRAALEETRGDLPASVQCWEQAIAAGTMHSVVDANLDQLLDKFMQLKISPNSGERKRVDPKLVDVKNVFKSTIIRFAVQQAKLQQTNQSAQPTYTMTPVRRSGRLSAYWSARKTPRHAKTPKTPLQICSSVRQAGLLGEKVLFVPNATLCETP